jgi:hypothetical protein
MSVLFRWVIVRIRESRRMKRSVVYWLFMVVFVVVVVHMRE